MAAIGPAHRLALDRAIALEIAQRHAPAGLFDRGDDLLGDRPLVEGARTLRGDRIERGGEIVEREMVADGEQPPVGPEEDSRRTWVTRQQWGAERQRVRERLVDRQALMREPGRRRNQIGEGKAARAVFAPGEGQSCDRAGDADAEPADQ